MSFLGPGRGEEAVSLINGKRRKESFQGQAGVDLKQAHVLNLVFIQTPERPFGRGPLWGGLGRGTGDDAGAGGRLCVRAGFGSLICLTLRVTTSLPYTGPLGEKPALGRNVRVYSTIASDAPLASRRVTIKPNLL